jgi:hypothetical protein
MSRILIAMLVAAPALLAQPRTQKAAAPVDLTGYWVSIVTEDWRWRMVTPIKGDFASIPINAEARKVGDAWDPAKDEAAGQPCKAYGAPAIMRIGARPITWQDDNTLRIDTDQGEQTRLFHFGGPNRQTQSRACKVTHPPAGKGLTIVRRKPGRPTTSIAGDRPGPLTRSPHQQPASRVFAQERRAVQCQRVGQ